jgi:ABC-type bacteriocin/lantibiotic exporter with double-glycine peptidase domain
MWEQYRKMMIPTQALIFSVCLLMIFGGKVAIFSVLIFFLIMQIFALIGARWALRLRRKIDHQKRRQKGLLE